MYPWETPKPAMTYVEFMDRYVRVSVSINGELKGSFAILDEGTRLDVETIMPDGTPLIFKVEGHPRTTDPMMTATELVNYVLTEYKR
jgi:hypothetical protein